MSLTRSLFNEFRPFFRLLEDPFAVHPASVYSRRNMGDPFGWHQFSPALNLTEDNGTYVVEAQVPGVRKENLDVRVGDGGRSITIEGRVVRAGQQQQQEADQPQQQQQEKPQPSVAPTSVDKEAPSEAIVSAANGKDVPQHSDTQAVADMAPVDAADKQVSTNTAWANATRTFTRTVWLPHAVDKSAIKARLEDGILTIKAPKAAQEAFNVNVE
jgi:HSP20 family molecular chaperone IbpA